MTHAVRPLAEDLRRCIQAGGGIGDGDGAFGTLTASFLPYMVPSTITIDQAAAPPSSLAFMFWGARILMLPLTLAYTAVVYFIFRSRVTDQDGCGAEAITPGLTTVPPATVPYSAARRVFDQPVSVLAAAKGVRAFFRLGR